MIGACEENAGSEHSPKGRPIATSHGTTVGTPLQKSIGPEGGTIAWPDGSVSIVIPAGAVPEATHFTIQPVTNSPAILSAGTTYRLGPESVQFSKPVEISFHYTDEDVAGTPEDFLYVGYQDADGYWHRLGNTALNKDNKTLKVSTSHFSDWTMLRDFKIEIDKAELKANETCGLTVDLTDYEAISGSGGDDFLLSPIKHVQASQVVSWEVINGVGTLSGGKNPTVTYTAPAEIGDHAEGIVQVTLKNVVNKQHPDRPGQSGMVIIRQSIPLLPDEYVKWEIQGAKYIAAFYTAALLNGETSIGGTSSTGNIGIGLNGGSAGTYDIGDTSESGTKASIHVTDFNDSFGTSYTDCESFETVYADGSVTITQFGAKGEYIEGYFSSTVYPEGCSPAGKKTIGSFRVKRSY